MLCFPKRHSIRRDPRSYRKNLAGEDSPAVSGLTLPASSVLLVTICLGADVTAGAVAVRCGGFLVVRSLLNGGSAQADC